MGSSPVRLAALHPSGAAAAAAIAGHQLAEFDIERVTLDHLPLVEATSIQGFALVFLLQAGTLEAHNITHSVLLALRFASTALFYSNLPDIIPILAERDE
jgi:hypothetical protein